MLSSYFCSYSLGAVTQHLSSGLVPETGYSVAMGVFVALNRVTQLFHIPSGLRFDDFIPGRYRVLSQQHDVGTFSICNPKAPRLEVIREDSSGTGNRDEKLVGESYLKHIFLRYKARYFGKLGPGREGKAYAFLNGDPQVPFLKGNGFFLQLKKRT